MMTGGHGIWQDASIRHPCLGAVVSKGPKVQQGRDCWCDRRTYSVNSASIISKYQLMRYQRARSANPRCLPTFPLIPHTHYTRLFVANRLVITIPFPISAHRGPTISLPASGHLWYPEPLRDIPIPFVQDHHRHSRPTRLFPPLTPRSLASPVLRARCTCPR